MHDRCVCIWY